MASVYFVTGSLGGGKTLAGVNRASEYLKQGRRVATNVNLYTEHLCRPDNKHSRITRVPDAPTVDDLRAIGQGSKEQDNNTHGLLLLDELGTWFNARDFANKERLKVIKFIINLRKRRWDVMFLVQDFSMVDKQIRGNITQFLVTCQSSKDHFMFKPFPKFHIGTVRLKSKIKVDTWIYRGKDIYDAYDTEQIYYTNEEPDDGFLVDLADEEMTAKEEYCRDLNGLYSVLPPGYLGTEVQNEISLNHRKIYRGRLIKLGVAIVILITTFVYQPRSKEIDANIVGQPEPERQLLTRNELLDLPPQSISDIFKNYRIVHYVQFGGIKRYLFTDGQEDISSDYIESKGYRVVSRGSREALVVGPDHEYTSIYK